MAASPKLQSLQREHPSIEVLAPSDAKWAETRETRGQAGQECKPLGIAIPKTADQVASIVRWATAEHVEISVRTGGNDFYGRNVVDDGLIIDMRAINSIQLAADKKSATIGGGVIAKDLMFRLEEEGVIAPFGNTWIVGYVGWATIGGYGPVTNLYGMGFEGILGAQVVTSQGEVVDAPEDMVEGIRGMGGNLGIITSLTFKVYPATKILSGMLLLDATPENIAAIVAAEAKLETPNALTLHNFVVPLQQRMLGIAYTWGDPDHDKGKEVLQTFIDSLPPVKINTVGTKTCVEHHQQTPAHVAPWGGQRSFYLKAMTPKIVGLLGDAMATMPAHVNFSWSMDIATNHNTCPSNCFGASNHVLLTFSDMVPEEHQHKEAAAWSDGLYKKLRGSGDPAVLEESYPSLTPPGDRTAAQLFGNKWQRVKELKMKYDPDNLFKNVAPSISLRGIK